MSPTLLIADDSASQRAILRHVLASAGFAVVEAVDGVEALAKLETVTPALIVTDKNMPGIDGIALVRAVRAMKKHQTLPILLLTTETDAQAKAEAREAGATGWIAKPFDPEKLIDLAHRLTAQAATGSRE